MREIKSQIPSRSLRVLSILSQNITDAISTVVSMTNFTDSKHTSRSLYQTFSSVTDTIIRSVAFFGASRMVLSGLVGISDARIVSLLSVITTIPLFFQIHSQIQTQLQSLSLTIFSSCIDTLKKIVAITYFILTDELGISEDGAILALYAQHKMISLFEQIIKSFLEEKESSSSVILHNSENDQLYHASGSDPYQIPEELKYPLTDEIFTTPVRPKDSKVEAIELSALQYWFEQKQKANPDQPPTHPMTRHVLDMKHLVIDEKLAKKAKNFVEKKVVTRIGNHMIYSSRLFIPLERKQCISLFTNYALFVLELTPPKSFENLVIGLSLFNMWISHLPASKNQTPETALIVYAHCVNLFRETQDMAVKNSKSQHLLAITHQPG